MLPSLHESSTPALHSSQRAQLMPRSLLIDAHAAAPRQTLAWHHAGRGGMHHNADWWFQMQLTLLLGKLPAASKHRCSLQLTSPIQISKHAFSVSDSLLAGLPSHAQESARWPLPSPLANAAHRTDYVLSDDTITEVDGRGRCWASVLIMCMP